eukprot:NODE_9901_length_1391_cov_8.289557.p4 GENE.NODE_9901_length_1391_cov_8.289557~~NODE_9901_length_1391_cov_8.289557.p4  ORF type:complete len:124 (-),score=16.41 NODE_9901_length_1391_cov_8.289557:564-935(-)
MTRGMRVPQSYMRLIGEKLYRNFIHVDDTSLYFMGKVRPYIASVPGFVEVQSQYFIDIFKGRVALPSQAVMRHRIKEDLNALKKQMKGQRFRSDAVEASSYYPTLASDVGRHPIQTPSPDVTR